MPAKCLLPVKRADCHSLTNVSCSRSNLGPHAGTPNMLPMNCSKETQVSRSRTEGQQGRIRWRHWQVVCEGTCGCKGHRTAPEAAFSHRSLWTRQLWNIRTPDVTKSCTCWRPVHIRCNEQCPPVAPKPLRQEPGPHSRLLVSPHLRARPATCPSQSTQWLLTQQQPASVHTDDVSHEAHNFCVNTLQTKRVAA